MNLLVTLLSLVALGGLPQEDGHLVRPGKVSAISKEGRLWFTVQAQNASALGVMREIARLSNRDLLGRTYLQQPTLVTVELIDRPLDQVLEFTLGSLGLRYELRRQTITILGDVPATQDEQFDLAAANWTRAAMRFPDHPFAAEARLAQGEISELRGLASAARNMYLSLTEDYPNASVVGEAYMRAGRISSQLGQWGEASRLFRTLATLSVAGEYHASARLEWARAMIAQGDPQAALYMLSALDTNYPAVDVTEATARRLVKARALNERGRFMEALEQIDDADPNFDDFGRWEALYIRAIGLEGIGRPGDAARAWLLYSNEAKGHDLALAYKEAARLSLEADDELATLFVVRRAELAGLSSGLEVYEHEARRRLGFENEKEPSTIADRIDEAEVVLRSDPTKATELVRSLYLARGALPDEETDARVCAVWARCLEATSGLAAAIEVLTEVRPSFESDAMRRVIDITAANLFEKTNRFDDAISAYQGTYAQP